MQQPKIQHVWSVLCLTSVTDKETNMLSLQNLVEQIEIESLPLIAGKGNKMKKKDDSTPVSLSGVNMELVSFLNRLDDWKEHDLDVKMDLELLDPTGRKINSTSFMVHIPKAAKRMRYRTKMNGITVTKPGEYWIKVSLNDGLESKEVSRLPLDIKFGLKI